MESRDLQLLALTALVVLGASLIYPFVWTQVKEDQRKGQKILDQAEQDVKEMKAKAKKDIQEALEKVKAMAEKQALTLKQAEDLRAEAAWTAQQAERDAKETKAIAEQEAENIQGEAQEEAAKVLEKAKQDAEMMMSQAKDKTRELWSWAEAKAKDANVTPEEWQEVQQAKKKILEEAKAEAEGIIAQARAQVGMIDQQEIQGQITEIDNREQVLAQTVMCQETPQGPAAEDIEVEADDLVTIDRFITERCVLGSEVSTKASDIYQAYLDWAEENGVESPMSQTRFGAILRGREFVRTRTNQAILWGGIGLR